MLFERTFFRTFSLICIVGAITVSGCNKPEPASTTKDTVEKGSETETERCRKKLAGAIRRLEPEQFAMQSRPERSIDGLNAWLASCAADELLDLELPAATLTMVDSSVRATAGRFTVNDAAYIRDCLLLRNLTDSIVQRATDEKNTGADQELVRTVAIFDWVIRNISLMPETETRLALGIFDVMLTGRGSPEDRAWIFAEALRQQQIDAVIVKPNAEPAAEGDLLATSDGLVAVAIENRLVLFDVKSGFPVTDGDNVDLSNAAPASVSVLREHERWATSTVQLVAQIAAFSPRMLVLQQQLAVEDSAVLYEELTGGVSEIRPLIERITTASEGLWNASHVSVWAYPEETSVAAQSLSEDEQKEFTRLMRPFDAPFERKPFATESTEELTTVPEELSIQKRQALVQQRLLENFSRVMESSEDMFGIPSKRLLKTRVKQILGANDTGVIQQLQQIRITSLEESVSVEVPIDVQKTYGLPPLMVIPFPKMVLEVNQSSTGDSLYWTAICQIERGDVGAAITTLMNYRRQYPGGRWTYPSMINQAFALMHQGRTEDAVTVLQEAAVEANPELLRVQRLVESLSSDSE